jgi:hypothetical protein
MKILIYADLENQGGFKLEEQIWEVLHQVKVSIFVHSINSLVNEVSHPMCGFSVLIFFASDMDNLRSVLQREENLKDLKKIIILPNDDEEFASLANQLQPSFMCHAEQSSDHVLDALNQMAVAA